MQSTKISTFELHTSFQDTILILRTNIVQAILFNHMQLSQPPKKLVKKTADVIVLEMLAAMGIDGIRSMQPVSFLPV